jgi:hypothetical protein
VGLHSRRSIEFFIESRLVREPSKADSWRWGKNYMGGLFIADLFDWEWNINNFHDDS